MTESTTTARRLLTPDQLALIKKPLPAGAVKDNPAKKGFSSIRAIFVTERLNDVFGVGQWQIRTDLIPFGNMPTLMETKTSSAGREYSTHYGVVKTTLSVPDYGIYYECIAGSQNEDAGDCLKGAATDGITKMCSYIGIGIDVFKGQHDQALQDYQKQESKEAAQEKLDRDVDEAIARLSVCDSNEHLTVLRENLPNLVVKTKRFRDAGLARFHEIQKAAAADTGDFIFDTLDGIHKRTDEATTATELDSVLDEIGNLKDKRKLTVDAALTEANRIKARAFDLDIEFDEHDKVFLASK